MIEQNDQRQREAAMLDALVAQHLLSQNRTRVVNKQPSLLEMPSDAIRGLLGAMQQFGGAADEQIDYYLGPTGIPDRLRTIAPYLDPGFYSGGNALADIIDPRASASDQFAASRTLSEMAALAPLAFIRGAGGNPIPGLLDELPTRQQVKETARNFMVSEYGGVPVPSINRMDPNEWRKRLEASLPASWLDPKFDKPQWHGISNVASELPLSDMQPVLRSTGTLEPEAGKSIESLVGRTGIPALGDRSIAGSEILGVGNLTYRNPVRSLGGADFMRESGTGIWANAAPQAEDLARTADQIIRAGGDPALIFTAMGPQSADFSTMMAESVMNQYDPRMIDPNFATRYDYAVRKVVPGFTSIMNPNFLKGLTGTDRWNLWQLMDKAELRRAGFPDINLARRGITDPRLMDVVPFDAGLTIGRPTGGLFSPNDTMVPHPTYPAQLAGAYEGGLERSIPGAILWRDFFKQRRASGASPGGDQRSFLMNANKIAQRIDQQTVDEAYQFFEWLRGLNDPTSPMRIWRGLLDG